jgi:hypothetical protein
MLPIDSDCRETIALQYFSVMVGLGPTIHEFLRAAASCAGKLVDGRAKHDHDEWSKNCDFH